MKKQILLVALTTLSISSAFAVTPLEQRQANREARQAQRIEQGVASGSLTQKEAARLENGQNHVDAVEAKALSDGKVTAKEKGRIEHAQDVQNRHIYKQKHDRQHDFNHDGQKDKKQRPQPVRPASK